MTDALTFSPPPECERAGCCDLSCVWPAEDPPAPGMVWIQAHHLVGMDLSLTCTSCGQHTTLAPPCVPGRWVSWAKPEVPLAELELDGRGSD